MAPCSLRGLVSCPGAVQLRAAGCQSPAQEGKRTDPRPILSAAPGSGTPREQTVGTTQLPRPLGRLPRPLGSSLGLAECAPRNGREGAGAGGAADRASPPGAV